MLYSSMPAVILSSACLKGILSTPLPKSLVNIIRVSSLHNLGLDGNFCDAKHPGAGPCTSPLETPDSVIYVWRSSSTTEPSSTGFCVKPERSSRLSYFVFLVSPSHADGALQRETCSIPGEELDDVGFSIPPLSSLPFSMWDCFSGWVATPDAAYLLSVNIFDRFKTFTWSILILLTQHFLRERRSVGIFFNNLKSECLISSQIN